MSRTRLAAAAGVAALTLGATAAVAADPDADQTVTIEVTAAPRSITVGVPAALSVVAGAAASGTTTSTLAYNAGPSLGKITVEIDEGGNGLDQTALTLGVRASGMLGSGGTASSLVTLTAATGDNAPVELVTNIASDRAASAKTVTYTLGGTAPSTSGDIFVVLKYTITDD